MPCGWLSLDRRLLADFIEFPLEPEGRRESRVIRSVYGLKAAHLRFNCAFPRKFVPFDIQISTISFERDVMVTRSALSTCSVVEATGLVLFCWFLNLKKLCPE